MTNLVETVARAIGETAYGFVDPCMTNTWASSHDLARAALTAIEAAGYRVVPVEPTERMEMAGKCELVTHEMPVWGAKYIAKMAYTAMLAAAPKVTE